MLQLASLVALAGSVTFAQAQDPEKTGGNAEAVILTRSLAQGAQDKKEQDEKKPKKVWTNEEVSQLKGGVSVVGDARAPEDQPFDKKNDEKAASNAHQAMTRHYRDAIAELKAQIANADALIAKFKNFKADDASPSGGVDPNRMIFSSPPEEQVKQLEMKKKQLEAKIEDLEVQASKEGIDPGELR